jgi:hypothetical protein
MLVSNRESSCGVVLASVMLCLLLGGIQQAVGTEPRSWSFGFGHGSNWYTMCVLADPQGASDQVALGDVAGVPERLVETNGVGEHEATEPALTGGPPGISRNLECRTWKHRGRGSWTRILIDNPLMVDYDMRSLA